MSILATVSTRRELVTIEHEPSGVTGQSLERLPGRGRRVLGRSLPRPTPSLEAGGKWRKAPPAELPPMAVPLEKKFYISRTVPAKKSVNPSACRPRISSPRTMSWLNGVIENERCRFAGDNLAVNKSEGKM
jgi:hypothetical protein